MRIGIGFDVHQFVEGRKLMIGGVEIPHEKGLLGHSDADVLIHAICDALLGALSLGDIGQHFPDTDERWRGANSLKILQEVVHLIADTGYQVGNIDCVIIAQRPKMAPHIPAIRKKLARVLEISVFQVSVKATTTEYLGFTGRGEGIAAQAVALLEKKAE